MTYEPGHTNYLRALQNVRAEMTLTANETNPILPASYQGYIGEKQGTLAYGEREDGMILRVSGQRARHVAALIKEKNIAGKTTRIDIQATAKTNDAPENYLSKVQSRVLSAIGATAGKRAKIHPVIKIVGAIAVWLSAPEVLRIIIEFMISLLNRGTG